MEKLVANKRRQQREYALGKFRSEIQEAVRTPDEKRTPYQRQIALLAEKQLHAAEKAAASRLPSESKKRYQELERQLSALPTPRPRPLPAAMAVTDVGLEVPPTHLLAGGDWRKPREELQPGFPHFLDEAAPNIHSIAERKTTGRRSALARWLTRKDNPLTARVIVNRLWQHHFGVGIVGTPSDFGMMGDAATHPELLDWLAVELVEQRLEPQAHAPADGAVRRLLSGFARRSRKPRASPGLEQSTATIICSGTPGAGAWKARRCAMPCSPCPAN